MKPERKKQQKLFVNYRSAIFIYKYMSREEDRERVLHGINRYQSKWIRALCNVNVKCRLQPMYENAYTNAFIVYIRIQIHETFNNLVIYRHSTNCTKQSSRSERD